MKPIYVVLTLEHDDNGMVMPCFYSLDELEEQYPEFEYITLFLVEENLN